MNLNKEQALAVSHINGPCIVTACPGSGKTRVLTARAISLIKDHNISPKNILCLTFTNKAANEMMERISAVLGDDGRGVWVSTFHKLCIVVLRKFSSLAGLEPSFSIYTGKDQEELMTKIARMNDYDSDRQSVMSLIRNVNDFRENAQEFPDDGSLSNSEVIVLKEYLETLTEFNAIDFSGILYKTWKLLNKNPSIQVALSNKFKYLLIDEMQDTNRVQYSIIKSLASHSNLFVVGDVNQSVYAFRGAKPENIKVMHKDFDKVKEIILPRNYRSTKPILNAAKSLINFNNQEAEVDIISDRGDGPGVSVNSYYNQDQESEMLISNMLALKKKTKCKWKDFACLYRTNTLSRSLEIHLKSSGIPYRMVGGFSFFDRSEIKIVMSYLSLLVNPKDTISFSRAVSNPKRQVGTSVIGQLERISKTTNKPILEVCRDLSSVKLSKIAKNNIEEFVRMYEELHGIKDTLGNVAKKIIIRSGYFQFLKTQCENRNKTGWEERQGRFDNVDDFLHGIQDFGETNPDATMTDYLQSLEFLRDIESEDNDNDQVTLLTMHAAKGLEWPCVFIIGAEAGIIPHYRSIQTGDIEEERRLMYVAMTRARDRLFISCCQLRKHRKSFPSSFLNEISNNECF